jgi:predicted nucleic acid-binding protein
VGLIDQVGRGPVAVDSALFIYFVEEHPVFVDLVQQLMQEVAGGTLQAVTSALTLLEVLVVPLRHGNRALADRYEALLTRSRGLRLVPLDLPQLRAAAQLRASYPGIRTPDALQLTAALSTGCTSLVTNDRRLPTVAGLRVLQLSDFA